MLHTATAAEERKQATQALGRIGVEPDTVVPALIAILRTETNAAGRGAAALALAHFDQLSGLTVPWLLAALHDPDAGVVSDVVDALGRLGPAAIAAVPQLRELAASPNHPARRVYTVGGGHGGLINGAESALDRIDFEWRSRVVAKSVEPTVPK